MFQSKVLKRITTPKSEYFCISKLSHYIISKLKDDLRKRQSKKKGNKHNGRKEIFCR